MALAGVTARVVPQDGSLGSCEPTVKGCSRRPRVNAVIGVVSTAAFAALIIAGAVTGNRTLMLCSIAPGAIATISFTALACNSRQRRHPSSTADLTLQSQQQQRQVHHQTPIVDA